ncbi:urea amidolyase associated protein UAAP1 [Paenibacillus montanisoli]|uniref:Urea carboxylase n=1 Tax=Paenibacillus montanisoli TaxID=2081970 RepID=A0A328UAI3_9BACL|nr:urea amidolyase associated protein UAAP1 [Paenibacillus montanisoli]RAP78321.1 urea carboxylase [Paenibacillus montanisoli]
MTSLWSKTIGAGDKWSGVIGKGKYLRFTALAPNANLSLMLFHANELTERYNMPDTLKAQHTAHLTRGNVLMSDNGRVLASIVEDELGWHDAITGYTTREATDAKYGLTRYQEKRNDWLRSGYENFAVELVRNGLGVRDMGPVVNLFAKVYCDDDGRMIYDESHCKEGKAVTLRTDMDLLLVLSNTPNPLNPSSDYPMAAVQLDISAAPPFDPANDYSFHFRPENRRAFENTAEYYLLSGR